MKNLITQIELVKALSDHPDLLLIDARAELADAFSGYNSFKTSHIKNAQFVSMEDTMTGKTDTHGGRHPLPDMDTFIQAMKKIGMTDSSKVVIYDDGNLAMAGRLWWLLRYAGKNDVSVLEGGINKWVENKLEVTDRLTEPVVSDSLSLNIDYSLLADIHDVQAAVHLPDTAIVDSRAYERYSGQVEPLDARPGHIPSALNYPWTDLVHEGKIIEQKEIEQKFKGLHDYKELLVHCGSGITGTVNILFMEEIGLKPKLYLGGYSDWVSYEELAVIKR